jgi:hypothetical protein
MTFAEAYLPTRLIDAGPSDVGSVRLVNSKELPRSAPYAALSHVWGTRPFLSTTSATLRDRERCIALSDMPANFRDAILFIRALGLQYIWIDSLCIVQDDKDDWKNESQKMGNVYSSAYITVVPVSTVSAHDGFLHRRQLVNRPVKITHTTVGSKPEFDHFYVDLPPITYIMKTHDIQNSVWNSRGWTFQERLLSKRLLYFTAYQLYFECQGSCWMENNTPPDLLRMIGNQPWVGVNTILAQIYSDIQGTIPDEWYLDWVEQYTQRQLTKPSDRLPALEGLARVISVPVSDLYIHGLWANDLARGLLWRLKNNSSSKIVAEIHTPTWTWARWQGAIRHETFFDLDGHVETVSCFKLLSTTNSEDEDSHKQPHCILAIEGKLAPMDKIIGDGTYPCRGGHSTHVWLDDVSTVKEGGKMFTFLVGRTATFEYEGDQPTSMTPHCLLLKAVVGKSNRYRRVGIMQLPDSKAKSLEDESEDVGLRDGDGDGEHKFLDEEHIFKDSLLQIFELE